MAGWYSPLGPKGWKETLLFVAGSGAMLLGGWTLIRAGADAEKQLLANDRRCLTIQTDIMMEVPRRADGPIMFEALGCRVQGEGQVILPKRVRQP